MQITRLTDSREIDLLIIRDTNTRRLKKKKTPRPRKVRHDFALASIYRDVERPSKSANGIKSLCDRCLCISRKEDAAIFPPEKLQLQNKPLEEESSAGGKEEQTKEPRGVCDNKNIRAKI